MYLADDRYKCFNNKITTRDFPLFSRLDFLEFTMKGPDVTVANFPCVPDYFQATGAATGRYLSQPPSSVPSLSLSRHHPGRRRQPLPEDLRRQHWLPHLHRRGGGAGHRGRPHCSHLRGRHLEHQGDTSELIQNVENCWLQVSQIPCSSRSLPPEGCLQYHTGLAGQVRPG